MARGDGGLHLVRARLPAPQGAAEHRCALGDLGGIPLPPVLVLQGHQVAVGVEPGRPACVVQQHQGQQARGLRLVRHQHGQHPGQPDRLGAQVLPDQVGACRGRVALVEQQVQHAQHARRAFRQQVGRRHPVGDPRVLDLLLGPDQPLGHGRLAGKERPGDLGRGQAGQRAQGQRDPGLEGEGRMAAGEHQPQPVVGDGTLVGGPRLRLVGHGGYLPEFGGSDRFPAQDVDGAVAGRRGQPRPAGPVSRLAASAAGPGRTRPGRIPRRGPSHRWSGSAWPPPGPTRPGTRRRPPP